MTKECHACPRINSKRALGSNGLARDRPLFDGAALGCGGSNILTGYVALALLASSRTSSRLSVMRLMIMFAASALDFLITSLISRVCDTPFSSACFEYSACLATGSATEERDQAEQYRLMSQHWELPR